MKTFFLLDACIVCVAGAVFGWLPMINALQSFTLGTGASFALLAVGAVCGFAAERIAGD